MVGAPGFEPGTSCAQGKRATRLRHAPKNRLQVTDFAVLDVIRATHASHSARALPFCQASRPRSTPRRNGLRRVQETMHTHKRKCMGAGVGGTSNPK